MGSHSCFAFTHFLQPHAYRWARCNTLQLAAEEFLHGLALESGTDRQLVAHGFRHAPYGDLYCHVSPALHAL